MSYEFLMKLLQKCPAILGPLFCGLPVRKSCEKNKKIEIFTDVPHSVGAQGQVDVVGSSDVSLTKNAGCCCLCADA